MGGVVTAPSVGVIRFQGVDWTRYAGRPGTGNAGDPKESKASSIA